MSVVAALVAHPARLLRLRAALRGRHDVSACSDWAAMTLLCERAPVQLAVIDLFAFGAMALEPLRQLKRRFPRLTTIAYVAVTAERAHDLFDAGRSGVDALIVADRDDDVERLRATVERAEARSVAARLKAALAHARPLVRDAVLLTVSRAHEQLSGESLARSLSVSRRVLAKHLEQGGLPSPQRLITWGRLVVAAHMLEDPQRSADSAAKALHFPSGSAFRNICQRYVQLTPSEIRARGGSDHVMAALLRDGPQQRGAPWYLDDEDSVEDDTSATDDTAPHGGDHASDPDFSPGDDTRVSPARAS